METKEMIEVMRAFEDGKKIQQSPDYNPDLWEPFAGSWDWKHFIFRVAPEPKKEGRWERVKIKRGIDGHYVLNTPPYTLIDACPRFFGFGGIDYQSPFNPSVTVRSMVPLMFEETGGWATFDFAEHYRPGIPVAAWFWREE